MHIEKTCIDSGLAVSGSSELKDDIKFSHSANTVKCLENFSTEFV